MLTSGGVRLVWLSSDLQAQLLKFLKKLKYAEQTVIKRKLK
jgi:archaellum component FlaD/FlaE